MWRGIGFALGLAALGLTGCGGSASAPAPESSAKAAVLPPEAVVAQFLEAVRTGKDDVASNLLTPIARQKTTEMELEVAPPGSDTASFKVGDVEYVAEDGAHVASEWTDLDETGQPQTDPIVWMVSRDTDGWRIAGMATKVFPDEPPLYLNFEDPADMMRKQQLVAAEIERRASGQTGQPAAQPAGAPATATAPTTGNTVK